MVKRGPQSRPQASEGEAQHGPFCWTRRFGQGDEHLHSKAIAIENDLRATLRNFGLKVGMVGKVRFEARIKELVEKLPDLAALVEPLLVGRRGLREHIA